MKKYLLTLVAVVGLLSVAAIGVNKLNPAAANGITDTDPLDIVVVFDVSGSMDYETTCFDCWEPNGADVIANPWPANGNFNPLPDITSGGGIGDICTQDPTPIVHSTGKYFVHEAEHYSRDFPQQGWRLEQRQPGQGFWVIQRTANRDASGTDTRGAYLRPHPFPVYSQSSINTYPQLQGGTYNNECFNGPGLSGACWEAKANILGESPPLSNPPYVEYDFTPDWHGLTHVWIRAQGSGRYGWAWNGSSPEDNPPAYRNLPAWRRAIFWQIGRPDGANFSDVDGRDFTNLNQSGSDRMPESTKWRWLKLGAVTTTNGVQHTLRLYQGSAGFNVDKIIFTDFAGGDNNTTLAENGQIRGNSSGITTNFKNFLNQNGGQGPAATAGSATREACNICNPVFGQTVDPAQCSCKTSRNDTTASAYGAGGAGVGCTQVTTTTNNLNNDLFRDVEPLRSAKEAVKSLANTIGPANDQLGLVAFSRNVYNQPTERSELQCLRWATANSPDGEQKCYNPALNPISYTNVVQVVENQDNTSSTNIAEGLREGLEELGIETVNNTGIDNNCTAAVNDKSVCDRQGTAGRTLILFTDGVPNTSDNCPATNLWMGDQGQGQKPYDCAIYYAQQAANANVSLFTIGLGPGPDPDLLAAMATGTDPTTGDTYFTGQCGQFFPITNLNDLDSTLEQVVEAARNCSRPPLPQAQITSLSGYDNIQPLSPFIVSLGNHPPGNTYDIYLDDFQVAHRICDNVFVGVLGDIEVACSLAAVPPGLYDLYSVVAGTTGPPIALPDFQVEVVSGLSALTIDKSGPTTAAVGQPILYTLTVTNNLAQAVNDLLITDTIPAGASYLSGGTRSGNVVSWPVSSLGAGATVQKSFIVTATQTITNDDYGVTSGDSYQAIGTKSVTTSVEPGNLPITCLDPLADQSFESSPSGWSVAFDQGVTRSPGQANSGNFKLKAPSFEGFPTNPWFYQTFTVPTWLTATNTSLYLTLHKNINALADGNQPDDQFFALVTADPSNIAAAVAARVTTPTVVAQGVMAPGSYDPTNWEGVTLSLPLLDEKFVETYRGQTLSLYLYNDSNNPGACSGFCATDFYFDDIKLDFCSSMLTPPSLAISKTAPAVVAAGQSVTYTLTVTNSGSFTATNLLITDTIPAGAHYISGGTQNGNLVEWNVPEIAPNGGIVQRSFVVTSTETLVNNSYGVQAQGGYQVAGSQAITTLIGITVPPVTNTVELTPGVTVAVDTDTFSDTVILAYDPIDPSPTTSLEHVNLFYDLEAIYASNGLPAQPQPGQNYEISLTYQPQNVPSGIDEADLALHTWDGSEWRREPTSTVDPAANTVTASPSRVSRGAVLASATDGNQRVFLPLIIKK